MGARDGTLHPLMRSGKRVRFAAMRTIAIMLGFAVMVPACSSGSGIEEAKRQAEAEDKAKGSSAVAASKVKTPVPEGVHIACDQLLDTAAFQKALMEVEPMTVKDTTAQEARATASCSIVRGGKRPNEAEQQALKKQNGRLGVLPGDESCNISAFCWGIDDEDHVKKKCAEQKRKDDDSMGSYACVQIVPTGEDDVQVFRFFDADTKCILQVRGGPSMTDNDYIRTCAKTARDTITPAQIAVKP